MSIDSVAVMPTFAGMTKLGFMFKDQVGMCQLKKYPFGTKRNRKDGGLYHECRESCV